MITHEMLPHLRHADVLDPEGAKIGSVGQIWVAEDSREPSWISVRTGLFGMRESFVPLQGAEATGDAVHVTVHKDQVRDAPQIDADGQLASVDERRLYEHYGLGPQRRGDHDRLPGAKEPNATEVVRSEERLRVGTERVETGRVRLRKYVVTEDQQVSVPVRHEEVRIEREPIPEGEAVGTRGTVQEEEHEVTLHGERPVVNKETVAVERIRVGTEVVADEQAVGGRVRKEQVEIDQDEQRRR